MGHLGQSSFSVDDAPALDLKDVKAGDVVVFETTSTPDGPDLVHSLICKLTNSPFYHAALVSKPLQPGKRSVETIESIANFFQPHGQRGVNYGTLNSEQHAVILRHGVSDMSPVVDAAKVGGPLHGGSRGGIRMD